MLQNIKHFYGTKLSASDGEIGHVQDFYFDDKKWVIRYVIADTGNWLAGRQVLLSPRAFGNPQQGGKQLQVNLTRKQIEDSPSIVLHKPVSRQFEEEYHRHYGWPCYWQGGGLWGPSAIPILEMSTEPQPKAPVKPVHPLPQSADPHIRSALAMDGYCLEATDGRIGYVCDYMMDSENWKIIQLVIKTGFWLTVKEVEIPTSKVSRISYDASSVFVNLTSKDVEQSHLHHLASADAS